jgi:hypothetical protein
MKTWTCLKDNRVVIVTADTVELARQIVERDHGIVIKNNTDLVPFPTHHRYARVIEPKDHL